MKKALCLILVLCVCLFVACDITQKPSGQTPTDTVEVLKATDNFVLKVDDSKDVELKDYLKYLGSTHTYQVSTEGKGIVEADLADGVLTISAKIAGTEKITVKLGDKSVVFTVTVTEEYVEPDFTAINALIAEKIAEQGDYTAESYGAYIQTIDVAAAAIAVEGITQARVDELANAINAAKAALAIREIEVKEAQAQFAVFADSELTIDYNSYFDTKELSNVTFEYETDLTLTSDGSVLTLNTTGVELKVYTITLKALYNNEVKKTVELTVEVVSEPTVNVIQEELVFNLDLYEIGKEFSLNLSANLVVAGDLQLTYFVNGTAAEDKYSTSLTEGEHVLNVVVKYTVEVEKQVEYKVILKVIDTTKYNVVNGSFNNGLDGWILEGDEFAGISEHSAFWVEGYPMFNVGKYFDGYAKDNLEPNHGTLTSTYFTLGGNGYITFMLGGAGNPNCFIKVEDKDGNILAIYRNTEFRDFTAEDNQLTVEERKAMIGNKINLCNLVKYKADLSQHIGKEIRIVLVDNAEMPWGLMFFDELDTYHAEEIGSEYVLAENQLADLTEAKAVLAGKITEQGDYTEASFTQYANAVKALEEAVNNPYVTQASVNELLALVNEASAGLTVREIEVKEAQTQFKVVIGRVLTLGYNDFFDTKELSNITFKYTSELELGVNNNVLTLNTAGVQAKVYTIVLEALYNNESKATVTLSVEITEDMTPTLNDTSLEIKQDKYLCGKDKFELDLAAYINNPGNLELTYTVDGSKLDSSAYTHSFDDKTSNVKVVVGYEIDGVAGQLEFTISLTLIDSTPYRVINGDFETGDLTGWTKVGRVGAIISDANYWIWEDGGYTYNKDGEYFFSAYGDENEAAYGYLKSSVFTVGGNGWITFKLGAGQDVQLINVQIVDAETGKILKSFGNTAWSEFTDGVKSGCTLVAYKADISDLKGEKVYIKVVDNDHDYYGLFFVDSFNTYHTDIPGDEFNLADNLGISGNVHQVFNGDFERGDLYGWHNIGFVGDISDNNAYWEDRYHALEGKYFFSSYAPNVAEVNSGYLESSPFEVGGNGWITFKYGGALNSSLTNIQVIDATTNEVLKVLWKDKWEDSQACTLYAYKADLSEFIGRAVYLKFTDYAWKDYGLFFVDSICTYYTSVPGDEFASASTVELVDYVINGDFEAGNLSGWVCVEGEVPGEVLNGSDYFGGSLNKDGDWSFQAVEIAGSGYNTEYRKGIIRSNTFVLNANSLFSFKLGGGNHPDEEGIRIVNAMTGEVIAQFTNTSNSEGRMTQYHYQFNNAEAIQCYVEIFDHREGGWGLVGVDSLYVNTDSVREGSVEAINQKK